MRRALLVGGALTVGLAGVFSLASCADILGIGNRQLEEGGTGGDAGGGPVVIAKDLNEPVRLVVDATGENLYWTVAGNEATNGGVYRYDIQSGKTMPLQEGLAGPTDLAIDDQYLYWINLGITAGQGQIVKCEIASGCKSTTLLETSTSAQSLAIDSTYLYWLTTDATLHKADKIDGSKATSLATTKDGLVAPDSCFVDPLSGDLLLSDPAGSVATDTVWRISKEGAGLTPLQTSAGCPCRFANSSSHDYWTSFENAKVVEVASSGGPTTLPTPQNGPQRMTVDVATNELYVANFGSGEPGNPDGTVVRLSANGKVSTTLAPNLNPVIDIVVAGSYAYFMTWGVVLSNNGVEVQRKPNTGSIVRVPK